MKGFLISDNMTYEPGANKYRKGLEKEGIYIKSYSDLLAEARRYNDDLYKMYEDISMKKNNKTLNDVQTDLETWKQEILSLISLDE